MANKACPLLNLNSNKSNINNSFYFKTITKPYCYEQAEEITTVAYKENILLSEITKLKATKYLVEKSKQFISSGSKKETKLN